jgi:DNA-binding NtrC family response regulator
MMKQQRILIVDDDENITTVFQVNLESNGYEVETAKNGVEALEKTRRMFFNLALIDIKLPDMEGTDLIELLREVAPKMRMIIVTGFPSLQNAINAVNKGADSYLLKPVDMEQLLKTIEEQLSKQRGDEKYTEEKVEEYIEARARELETLIKYHKPI